MRVLITNFGDFKRLGTFLPRGIKIVGAWLSNPPIYGMYGARFFRIRLKLMRDQL